MTRFQESVALTFGVALFVVCGAYGLSVLSEVSVPDDILIIPVGWSRVNPRRIVR
jgi:hypothetical protein